MGIDRKAIKERLARLQNSTNKTSNLWKPSGKSTVRIVPYKFRPDNPFIELWFHWGLGGKNYLSPKSYGKPDPILEFAIKLRESGDKESYELSRKLFPKMRTYAPIIVKDDDSKEIPTVKFWGFGKGVYESLLDLIADDDYGDIADPVTGTDLIVEFKTPEEVGNKFGSITVKPRRKASKLHNDPKVVEKILNEQQDITEIYQEKTYDELKEVLSDWLTSGSDDTDSTDTETTDNETVSNDETKESVATDTEDKFKKLFNDGE